MRSKIYRWIPVALCMALIFFLSAQPKLPSIPLLDEIDYSDKIKHAFFYGILGWLAWRAIDRKMPKWRQLVITIVIAAIYGLTDEYHQLFVPGRTFDLLDLSADTLGASIAAIILTVKTGGDVNGRRTIRLRGEGQKESKP